jgi:hypothetical protein
MGVSGGPNIVRDSSLVLELDAADRNSYVSQSLIWNDVSGNNNSGSLTNGPTFSNNNIVFDGVDDTVNFASSTNATTVGLNGYHSVDLWVRPSVVTADRGMFSCDNGGVATNRNLHYIIRNSKFYLGWYNVDVGGVQTIFANTWYNVVFLLDTDMRQKIYVNGILDAQGSPVGAFFNGGTATIQIGVYTSQYFSGLMGICKVYNRALSPQEVLQNYNAQKSRFGLK